MRRPKSERTPGGTPTMHPDCAHLHSIQGGGDDSSCSCSSSSARLAAESSCPGDVRIQLGSSAAESRENPSSRGPRAGSQSRGHGEAAGPEDAAAEPEEQGGSSLAELRCLLQWLHRSLPYLLILSVKLLMQHSTGISLGIGLLTTYAYANKSIVNQVFLRERCSKLQCTWLLLYLSGSSLLLYYTFHSQALYHSLIFLSPTVDFMNFWEVLWIVGVTDFILKFLFMGLKCFILLVPSFIMSFKSKECVHRQLAWSSWSTANFAHAQQELSRFQDLHMHTAVFFCVFKNNPEFSLLFINLRNICVRSRNLMHSLISQISEV